MPNFDKAFKKVIGHEGGYVNDPDDNGGETKYGISKRAYPQIDIKNLTLDGAKEIYKKDYWTRLKCDDINSEQIAIELFDMGVNSGNKTAVKIAQSILDIAIDGIIGTKTIAAINEIDEEKFLLAFKLGRVARYVDICNKNKTQSKFLLGWCNRVLGSVK